MLNNYIYIKPQKKSELQLFVLLLVLSLNVWVYLNCNLMQVTFGCFHLCLFGPVLYYDLFRLYPPSPTDTKTMRVLSVR